MPDLTVAAWQCASHPGDVAGNLARLEQACRRAAERGADVLVTPEMFLTGYDIGEDLTRSLAEPAAGPSAALVDQISRRTGVAVLYGFPERDGDAVYNAIRLTDGGDTLDVYRKAHLFGDLDAGRFARGDSTPPVVPLRGRMVSTLICYDVEFPETVRWAAAHGASVILVPTANMVGYEFVNEVLVRARAYENGVGVVYANFTGTEGSLAYVGGSAICAPDGSLIASAGSEEALLVSTMPASTGAYLSDRRTDLYG
jgi:predicted amidohydrolase